MKKLLLILALLLTISLGHAANFNLKLYSPTAPTVGAIATGTQQFTGTGSWYNNQSASKVELYLPITCLGTFKIDDIESLQFSTKKALPVPATPNLDYYWCIYTHGTEHGWYGERLNSEPMYYNGFDAPYDQWSTFQTSGASNQMTFFDSNHGPAGYAGAPTLDNLQAGPISFSYTSPFWSSGSGIDYGDKNVKYISISTGSGTGNSSMLSYLDNVIITMINGNVLTIDLEDGLPQPVTVIQEPSQVSCGNYDVNVTASDFSGIGALSLILNYDPAILSYTGVTLNPVLGSVSYSNVPGIFTMGQYFSPNLVSIPDNGILFTLHFNLSSVASGTPTTIEWKTEPGACEYAGPNGTPIFISTFNNYTWSVPVRPVVNQNTHLEYCKIQDAIDDVATLNNHVITVASGTYTEDIVINKSIDLRGPNYGNSGVRVSEAVIIPQTSDPDPNHEKSVVTITANNVSFNGFKVDGNNPYIQSNILLRGADLDASIGIHGGANVSGITISRNIVTNATLGGLWFENATGTAVTNNYLSNNIISNIGYNWSGYPGGYGIGILIYNNFYANIASNTITEIRRGIQTGNFSQANTGGVAFQKVESNIIEATNRGIFHNLHYSSASAFTLKNNQISADDDFTETNWYGIFLSSLSVPSQCENNVIDGTGTNVPTSGYNLWNVNNTTSAVITGGSVSGVDFGIFANNFDGYGSPAPQGAHAIISGVSISPKTTGIGIRILDNPLATGHANVNVTLGSGVAVTGGTKGVHVENSNARLVAASNLALVGQTGKYFELSNNGFDIDATAVTFESKAGSEMTNAELFAVEDKIDHRIENKLLGFVTVKSENIYVTPAGLPSATNNDYTRLRNALSQAANNWTINLHGTFDWNETNAAASWALGNDDNASLVDDNYTLLVPANLTGVTFTAPEGLGNATIQGPGDLPSVNLEGFLNFWLGNNQYWTISKLRILDFDLAIGMFYVGSQVNTYDNTLIDHNYIRLATDLNITTAPLDLNQNIGIHFAFGTNQTISNNIIDIPGDGISDGVNYSSSVGMQSNTSGGAVYSGLSIHHNTINVLNAQSSNPQTILGIWENSHGHSADINIANNSFLNLAAGNNPSLNLQRGFRVTSHSSASTTVAYAGNTVNGANIGFQWIAGGDFSANQPVEMTENTILNCSTGVLIQSHGKADISASNISANATGIRVTEGSLLSSCVNNFISNNTIAGIKIENPAGIFGEITENDLSGNPDGNSINNQSTNAVSAPCNWYGSATEVTSKITGNVDYTPWLTDGTDNLPDPGFQKVPNSCSGLPVVTGTVKYFNPSRTVLDNVLVKFYQNGSLISSGNTDDNGVFTANGLDMGTYDVQFTTSKAVGGINATDAAQVNYWGVASSWIEKVRFLAGDVAGAPSGPDNNVTSIDAGRIVNYFVTMGNVPFTPEWSFWKTNDVEINTNHIAGRIPSITITSDNMVQNFYGLASGDFNMSFTPGAGKLASDHLTLDISGSISPDAGSVFELPVFAASDLEISAVSLIMNIPSDKLEVLGVYFTNDAKMKMDYSFSGDELRIGWLADAPVSIAAGERLMTIKMSLKETLNQPVRLTLAGDDLNEIAGADREAIESAVLYTHEINGPLGTGTLTSSNLTFSNYPNPFTDQTTFTFNLPSQGDVKIELFSILGSRIKTIYSGNMAEGEHTLSVDGSFAEPGVYFANLQFTTNSKQYTRTIKIIAAN